MEIRNAVQFYNFLIGCGLRNLTKETSAFSSCIEHYNIINCGKCTNKDIITKKYNECSDLYVKLVMSIFPQYKTQIMSKLPGNSISFYKEGQHIRIITR